MSDFSPTIIASLMVTFIGLGSYLVFRSNQPKKDVVDKHAKDLTKFKRWINSRFIAMDDIMKMVETQVNTISNHMEQTKEPSKKEIGMWDDEFIRLLERLDLIKTSLTSFKEGLHHEKGEKWEKLQQRLLQNLPKENVESQEVIDLPEERDVFDIFVPDLEQRLEGVKKRKRTLLESIQAKHDELDKLLASS